MQFSALEWNECPRRYLFVLKFPLFLFIIFQIFSFHHSLQRICCNYLSLQIQTLQVNLFKRTLTLNWKNFNSGRNINERWIYLIDVEIRIIIPYKSVWKPSESSHYRSILVWIINSSKPFSGEFSRQKPFSFISNFRKPKYFSLRLLAVSSLSIFHSNCFILISFHLVTFSSFLIWKLFGLGYFFDEKKTNSWIITGLFNFFERIRRLRRLSILSVFDILTWINI